MSNIKILIADDHAVVREGTRQILEQERAQLVGGALTVQSRPGGGTSISVTVESPA